MKDAIEYIKNPRQKFNKDVLEATYKIGREIAREMKKNPNWDLLDKEMAQK